MRKITCLLAFLLISPYGMADWAVKGEGNFSCPDYVDAKRSNSSKLYSSASWVQGFISGVNYHSAREPGVDSYIGQDYPAASMVSWLANYCNDNPQDYLSDAAEALVVELQNRTKN